MVKLVRRNLFRNKRRTFLTVASVAVAVLLLSLLAAVLAALPHAVQLIRGDTAHPQADQARG